MFVETQRLDPNKFVPIWTVTWHLLNVATTQKTDRAISAYPINGFTVFLDGFSQEGGTLNPLRVTTVNGQL